ncbi:MAG: polysaccharide biosynthesis tyrosine autokinase [Isosphaerales bacterium]
MNPESHFNGEPDRPVTNSAAVFAAAPQDLARGGSVFRSGLARPDSATALSPTSILRALHRRQLLALGVAILAAGICGPAAWFLVPPAKFKAQARLQVAAQAPKVLFRTVETEGNEDYKRYQNTQQTLVTSQLALNAALRNNEVSKYRTVREQVDPIAWLQANLKVEFIAASEVMEISLSGENRQELAGIVNAVKKAYIDEVVNVDIKARTVRHDQLKKLKKQYDEMLKERRANLRELAQTVGSDDRQTLAYRQQIAMEHLAYIRKDLADVQSQKRKAQARLKAQRPEDPRGETSAPPVTEDDINAWIDGEPSIASLIAKLAQDEQKLNSETAHFRVAARNPSGDPLLKRIQRDVAATRKLLKSKREALRPVAIKQLEEKDRSNPITPHGEGTIQQELAMFEDLERSLTAEVKTITEGDQVLTDKTLDLQSQQDDVAQMQASALKVGAEVEALTVELMAPPRIRTIEDAVAPLTRDDKKRLATIGLIIVGSFFGGLFGIAFLELQNQKVDSADDVPTHLGLQVVGTLPILRSKANRGGGIARRQTEKDRYWNNLMLESIDATRTMLIHAARTGSHRVVMITSAVGGEGKTSLASHLATSLARSGLRTLLIDADLRSPSIHRLFNLPVAMGLSEVIRGEVEWTDAIAATTIDDLKVLTAGRCDRQTICQLSQGCLSPLFLQLKEQFDFVIVDSSPILPVADGLIIAQHVDAVLFSIFRDVSRKTKVAAASERLQCLNVRILGAVVTGEHGGRYGNDYDPDSPYRVLPEPKTASSELS